MVTEREQESPSEDLLDAFRRLNQLLQDRVRTVAQGFHTGAYVHGRPGTGKTHTVRAVLESEGIRHVYLNGRITPAALFESLAATPQAILVIDDVTTLIKNPHAAEMLMAATGGEANHSRCVTYRTKAESRQVAFRGGIVAISNRPLRHDPAGAALASRLAVLEYEPSEEMLIAFARSEATQGVQGVPPSACHEVLEFVVEHGRSDSRPFDLRLYFKTLSDYKACHGGISKTKWQTLVRSLGGRVRLDEGRPRTRAETQTIEQEIVRELEKMTVDVESRLLSWKRQTGKCPASYYRRRGEILANAQSG